MLDIDNSVYKIKRKRFLGNLCNHLKSDLLLISIYNSNEKQFLNDVIEAIKNFIYFYSYRISHKELETTYEENNTVIIKGYIFSIRYKTIIIINFYNFTFDLKISDELSY